MFAKTFLNRLARPSWRLLDSRSINNANDIWHLLVKMTWMFIMLKRPSKLFGSRGNRYTFSISSGKLAKTAEIFYTIFSVLKLPVRRRIYSTLFALVIPIKTTKWYLRKAPSDENHCLATDAILYSMIAWLPFFVKPSKSIQSGAPCVALTHEKGLARFLNKRAGDEPKCHGARLKFNVLP